MRVIVNDEVELTSVVSKNTLLFGTPVPDHHGAVLRPGDDVAVLTHVALGPRNARCDVVMTKHSLDDLPCDVQHFDETQHKDQMSFTFIKQLKIFKYRSNKRDSLTRNIKKQKERLELVVIFAYSQSIYQPLQLK